MEAGGNPFGAPLSSSNNMAGNPFGPPMAGTAAANPAAAMQQEQHGIYGPQPPHQQHDGYAKDAMSGGDNPFGTPPPPGHHYGQPLSQQQPQQQHQFGGYPVYQQQPGAASYDGATSGAMVPSTQPTNPYAVANPFFQQIVPATHQNSQWAVNNTAAPAAAAAKFDPFAAAPPPAVTPPQYHQQQQQQRQHNVVYPMQDNDDIFGEEIPQKQEPGPQPAPASPTREVAAYSASSPDSYYNRPDPPPPREDDDDDDDVDGDDDDDDDYNSSSRQRRADPPSSSPPVSPRTSAHQNQYGHSSMENQYGNVEAAAEAQRNRYSQELSRRAPPGASPLPKAELVRKRGFVLSRISFRTIVMKKWKQSFWVQYGPHTMLWFRSQSDFDDWLNNPYHTQAQRNFLIKLAVNFVHDLYKPSVRGYQVTQCRTKAYGAKMIRQFKLERWMDYGPTIAAAFGSYNPKEVDDLREALVECMRNTPLNGGIRATGAVRQPNPQQQQQQQRQQHHDDTTDADNYGMHTHPPERGGRNGAAAAPAAAADLLEVEEEAVVPTVAEKDLLDMNDWDASGGAPPPPSAGASPPPYSPQQQQQPGYSQPHAVYGVPGYPQQQQGYPPQQQQAGYSNAMVPVGGPQPYPGAMMYAQEPTVGASTPGWLQQQQQQPQQQRQQHHYQEY